MLYLVNQLHRIESFKGFIYKINNDFTPPLLPRIEVDDYFIKLKQKAVTITCENGRNEIVGLLAMYSNNTETKLAYITLVGVIKEYRGQGIASHLVDKAIKEAAKREMLKVGIHTNSSLAKACYVKAGFMVLEEMIKDGYTRYYLERSL